MPSILLFILSYRMKAWVSIGVVVLIIGGIIFYNKVLSKPQKQPTTSGGQAQPISIQGFIANTRNLTNHVVASGTLMPAEQIELHPEVSGRITQLSINEGNSVAKGTLLVKLYDADLQAQLQKLNVQRNNQEKIVERTKRLLDADNVSQQDYEGVVTQLNSLQADISLVKAQIAKTELRAPFSGVIGLRNVSPGAYVTPATIIASLQQVNPLKIDFFLPEKYAATIKPKARITFDVDGFEEDFSGQVYATEPAIDQNTRSLKVRALVDNSQTRLHAGAYAHVKMDMSEIEAVMVPTQAIIPQARGKQLIVAKNGKATFLNIETGLRDENTIQITKGLSAGDTVVTTGVIFVKPNQDLKFSKIEHE